MITWRENLILAIGAGGATIVLGLMHPLGVAGGFFGGFVVVALLARRTIRRLIRANEALAEACDSFKLELLGAWGESDRRRADLGLAPLSRPPLADLSRTARSQEDPCSSVRSSAA